MVIKAILSDHGFDEIERETIDIDANWIGRPPTMDYLVVSINHAFDVLRNNFQASALQEYTDKQSANILIIDKETGLKVVLMDVKIKQARDSKIYYCGELNFRGVMVNEILADKISVLSGDKIFRRIKDLVDVYALSQCVDIQTTDIFETCEREGCIISSFGAFLNRREELKHAYNKLKRIDGKPAFDEIYDYMMSFICPFVEQTPDDVVWDNQANIWVDSDRYNDIDYHDLRYKKKFSVNR